MIKLVIISLALASCSSTTQIKVGRRKYVECKENQNKLKWCLDRIINGKYQLPNTNVWAKHKHIKRDFNKFVQYLESEEDRNYYHKKYRVINEQTEEKPLLYGLANGDDSTDENYDDYELIYKMSCKEQYENVLKTSPENWFDYYCENGKQKRRLVEKFSISINHPNNLPHDKTQYLLRKSIKRAYRISRDLNFLTHIKSNRYELGDINKKIRVFQNGRLGLIDARCFDNFSKLGPIINNYTAKIPLIIQDDIFDYNFFTNEGRAPNKTCSTDVSFDEWDKKPVYHNAKDYIGVNNRCEFKPSELLNDRERFWSYYLYKNQEIKESIGEMKGRPIIKYEISVDLSFICQYGINISELQSKTRRE